METRKLYYEDSHLRAFSAQVLRCGQVKKGWEVTLDQTAFYPEGGGPACDLGTLGGVPVLDVQVQGDQVIHLCAGPLETGGSVEGEIVWERRFDLMQQHTGEHMVSGIINRLYGAHNVGFHMGWESITIDFDVEIPPRDLPKIEALVNEAIWRCQEVECRYPSEEELPTVFYRTKKALPWPVRIVRVGDTDSCACCGVHVARTGEVGLIKLFSVVPLRGGCRIEMSCGSRALKLLNQAFDQNRLVSQAFSAQWFETGEAARKMNEALSGEKFRMAQIQKRIFEMIAKDYVNFVDVVHFEPDLDSTQVRMLADAIAQRCDGTVAVFSGTEEEGYAYAMVDHKNDLRTFGKEMTAALHGRGGGKPTFQQGRVAAKRQEIEAFFAKN